MIFRVKPKKIPGFGAGPKERYRATWVPESKSVQ